MDVSEISLQKTNNRVKLLMLVLLNTDAYTFLPELLDLFGEDKLLKFLDVFSGTSIQVPSREKLGKSIRDVDIFCRLEYAKHKPTYKELSEEYEVSEKYIYLTYNRIKALMENTSEAFVKIVK